MKILLVDDEPDALDVLEDLLRKSGIKGNIFKAAGLHQAYKITLENDPDLVFLDVQLNKHTGFDYIERIGSLQSQICIVFVTAYSDYAIKAIKQNAFDYLLKPIDEEELQKALAKFQNQRLQNNHFKTNENKSGLNAKIKMPAVQGTLLLNPDEILYLKADGNYCYIHLANGKFEHCSTNLGRLAEILPQDQFFKISRSTVINTNYLNKIDKKRKNCVLQINGEAITIPYSNSMMKELERLM